MDSEQENEKCRLIVSFTSFPARISGVPAMLETIYAQTHPADLVLLWLAKEQFPEREKQLPPKLLDFVQENKLVIRWCDDLRPHKKYFYALQEYPNDVIVLVDDDLLFKPQVLEWLYASYQRYPRAISAMRAHLVTFSENGEPLPYKCWVKEVDVCMEPSMNLFVTSGMGTLFPPGIMPPDTFDKDAIVNLCINADDLWLKTMQLLNNVPVVLASEDVGLRYVPGSQEVALYNTNKDKNDEQLHHIIEWSVNKYGYNIWKKKMIAPAIGADISGAQAVFSLVTDQRDKEKQKRKELNLKLLQERREKSEANAKLQRAYKEKSEINARLQQTYKEKSEINAKLQQTYKEKSEMNAKLKQTYQEKFDRGVEIKRLNGEIAQLQATLKSMEEKLGKREKEISELEEQTASEQSDTAW